MKVGTDQLEPAAENFFVRICRVAPSMRSPKNKSTSTTWIPKKPSQKTAMDPIQIQFLFIGMADLLGAAA